MAAAKQTASRLGDLWGGLGAMLVALPSAIAFGVVIHAPLGGSFAAVGAVAGILGTIALALVAATVGGTRRLISAPCAPAAAILTAFAVEQRAIGVSAESVLVLFALVGLVAGLLQVLFGLVGIGRLIRYMPYPVVSGYLTSVGIIIITGQVPRFLGVPVGVSLTAALESPAGWSRYGIGIGIATIVVMLLAPRLTKAIPATILALAAGLLAYFALAYLDRSLLHVVGNPLVVGPLATSNAGFVSGLESRWLAIIGIDARMVAAALVPGATLAVLLSIDTLKTCVVLDTLTRSRHDSNRELVGQGLGNLAATAIGGLPGAGTVGPTLISVASGSQTNAAGVVTGICSLAAFLVFGRLIAWVPIAALAGILIVIGLRMIDWHSIGLLRRRTTALDFVIIAAVVLVAETRSLAAASAVGVAIAILLFIRQQVGVSIVHRRTSGAEAFSKHIRLPDEMRILDARGHETAIFELQGNLFFGTADQLYRRIEPVLASHRHVIIDLARVRNIDLTAAHTLDQIENTLIDRGAVLLISAPPRALPDGGDLHDYFDQLDLLRGERRGYVFDELDQAIEWVENRILAEANLPHPDERPLEVRELEMFTGRRPETLTDLEACLELRSYRGGDQIFACGDRGDELYFIRRGEVRVLLPIADQPSHHLATFGRGNFIGEMSFLDAQPRSADAVALNDTDLYVLSRRRFDELAANHKRLAEQLMAGLARTLVIRLRYADAEVRALRDPGPP